MKSSRLRYGVFAVLAVSYVLLWLILGDPAGALWSLIVLLLGVTLLAAVIGFLVSTIPDWLRRIRGISQEDHLANLEASGKAVREVYEANQVLTVEKLDTGSIMHFIDVGHGNVLCLVGQYYFDFEPIDDDLELKQTRRFPTNKFSLLRRTKTGEVLALFPGSTVIEPTVCDPVVTPHKLYELGFELRDGEVVSDSSMDAIERIIRDARHEF